MIQRDADGRLLADPETGDVTITGVGGQPAVNARAFLEPSLIHCSLLPVSVYLQVYRQKRTIPAPDVASGCDGRSNTRQCSGALGNHGRRRGLSGWPLLPHVRQEVLLTIAYVGCITLFVAATIAIVATDIKKVWHIPPSVSWLHDAGSGVFGWGRWFVPPRDSCVLQVSHVPQFRQCDLWLSSRTGDDKDGWAVAQDANHGLYHARRCHCDCRSGHSGVIAFSGYHSKDAVVASALAFSQANPGHFLLFITPLITAGITAFYMFRLWFYTFVGQPRDQHVYDHCHESPLIMTAPLLLLSVFAAFSAFGGEKGPLFSPDYGRRATHVAHGIAGSVSTSGLTLPSHHAIEDVHTTAGSSP